MALGPALINKTMNTKFGKWLMGPYSLVSPVAIATVSCLTKDGTNCYYYTKQALNNKKIPDDKRGFVAGLDLANGILNIITQLSFAIFIDKNINKFYDKHIGNKLLKELPDKIFNKYAKTKTPITQTAAKNCAKDLVKAGRAGLGVIVTLVATQVFCKRVIVPLIATPMASHFKKKFEKNNKGDNKQLTTSQIAADTVSFENRMSDVAPAAQDNKKLPDCFHSFMK